MKTPSTAVKLITVSVFTVLIVSFVCYRAGAFDNHILSENNFDVSNAGMAVDTPKVKQDSLTIELDREMMSSSKSMKMTRPLKQDTSKKTEVKPVNQSAEPKKSNYMGSSKSAVIFEPEPQKQDTVKKPKK